MVCRGFLYFKGFHLKDQTPVRFPYIIPNIIPKKANQKAKQAGVLK
tara:strand:+ start:138 stop:275 length:138 start_codon:yes stop_codon:yes gene_type:complete